MTDCTVTTTGARLEVADSVQRIDDQLRPQFDDRITLIGSNQLSELRAAE